MTKNKREFGFGFFLVRLKSSETCKDSQITNSRLTESHSRSLFITTKIGSLDDPVKSCFVVPHADPPSLYCYGFDLISKRLESHRLGRGHKRKSQLLSFILIFRLSHQMLSCSSSGIIHYAQKSGKFSSMKSLAHGMSQGKNKTATVARNARPQRGVCEMLRPRRRPPQKNPTKQPDRTNTAKASGIQTKKSKM